MVTPASNAGHRGWTYWPWHVLLLGAYPVLFLFAQNMVDAVRLDPLWGPLLLCIGAAAGLLVLFFALRRDWARAGLMASAVLALFFSFGHVWGVVDEYLDQKWLLGAIWIVWGLALVQIAWRGGRWVGPLTRVLNVALGLLVIYNLGSIGAYMASIHTFAGLTGEIPEVSVGPLGRPDVYYIVLDRYAGEETLRRFFNYDNSEFLEALEDRGFDIAHDAWANYFKTSLSVFSTMTMDYLDADKYDDDNPDSFGPVHAAFAQRMAAPATFKQLGYEYVHIANWWEPTSRNADADITYRYSQESEFSTILFATTLLSVIQPDASIEGGDTEELHGNDLQRAHILTGFESILEASERSGPTFTFAHLTIPHPPYAFNEDGSEPTAEQQATRTDNEGYVEQLKYANRRVLEVIDQILATHDPSEPDPVILIQADEGPFPPRFREQGADFQWLEATPDELQWKYNTLTAWRMPGVVPEDYGFYDRISPVNMFRIFFDAYFNADLPILPDKVYLSPDHDHMWDLHEYQRPEPSPSP
ncbi:MAG TPA: hypothetical protein VIC63_08070 [Candidatus Limnocylindria bacterium]